MNPISLIRFPTLRLLTPWLVVSFVCPFLLSPNASAAELLQGKEAMGDWTTDAPGVRRQIQASDLPQPSPEQSAKNHPKLIQRPDGALPQVPDGFQVTEFANGLRQPRVIVTAPNGDLFVSESQANRIRIFRDANHDGEPEVNEVFADGLKQPFGIAFHPQNQNPAFIYIANTDGVVRFPYHSGETKAQGKPEVITSLPSGGRLEGGGHWTRDIAFSLDGKTLFMSVGSKSNVDDSPAEADRARIFASDPDGSNKRVFATGIRNPVGLAIHPVTGDLWTSVNERDELGDNLVPDYITRVREGGFYGWPWFYIGGIQDPRHPGAHPELKDKVITPDVLIQAHSASLDLSFYTGKAFPSEYQNNAFAAEHGSWNRSRRTGYKVIRVPAPDGIPSGEYIDFMTGFVTSDGDVWGRPVGVCTGADGALFVTDDGGNRIWRVTFQEK